MAKQLSLGGQSHSRPGLFRFFILLMLLGGFVSDLFGDPIEVIHAFKKNAVHPQIVVRGKDGTLYGIATSHKSFFKVTSGTAKLVSFLPEEIAFRDLVSGEDGNFYGSISFGSSSEGLGGYYASAIYRITPSGEASKLVDCSMRGRLVKGIDGNFYITQPSYQDGQNVSKILRLTTSGETNLLAELPHGIEELISSPNGTLYGSTAADLFPFFGGSPHFGSVFSVSLSGQVTTLATFTETNAVAPAGLAFGADGKVYGTASQIYFYSANMAGLFPGTKLFSVSAEGALTMFPLGPEIRHASSGLTAGADGGLYFSTSISNSSVPVIARMDRNGTVSVFYKPGSYLSDQSICVDNTAGLLVCFPAGGPRGAGEVREIGYQGRARTAALFHYSDTESPQKLVTGRDGDIYGYTSTGSGRGHGMFFTVQTDGTYRNLCALPANTYFQNSSDSLISAINGNFYGNTFTYLFKVTRQGVFTPLTAGRPSSFTSLVQTEEGVLFATVSDFFGKIVRVDEEKSLATLFNFSGTNGWGPSCLIDGKDGSLYGVTRSSGNMSYIDPLPTVFKYTDGIVSTVCTFTNASAAANLLKAPDGNLYGTILRSGFDVLPPPLPPLPIRTNREIIEPANLGLSAADAPLPADPLPPGLPILPSSLGGERGVIFRVSTNGVLTNWVVFALTNGIPNFLFLGSDGALYGTTRSPDNYLTNASIVFRVTANGALTVLHRFTTADGSEPASVAEASDGGLYGTMRKGGPQGGGSIFKIPGIFPPKSQRKEYRGDITYNGTSVGRFDLAISGAREIRGRIYLAAEQLTHSVTGQLDDRSQATFVVPRLQQSGVTTITFKLFRGTTKAELVRSAGTF